MARSKRATRSCTSSSGIVPRNAISFHDDLINRNLLVDGDRISAFLDWGSSIYGDFLYDIAKLVFHFLLGSQESLPKIIANTATLQ